MDLAPPGFFGKIPARGDFVRCRIDPPLAQLWDGWLGLLTIAARDSADQGAGAGAWPEVWLTAPLWHFALGSGLAPAPGAAGVLVASMDRVGRMFPFTIIGPADGLPGDAWRDAVEALVLQSLGDTFDPDRLDAALAELGPPGPAAPPGPILPAGSSLWHCRGSDRVGAGDRLHPGLPNAAEAAAMVLGP